LLLLLPSVPEPADTGAKLRNRGLLNLATAEHTVDVLAFGSASAWDWTGIRRAQVIPQTGRSAAKRVLDAGRSELPDMAQRLWSPAFQAVLEGWLAETNYDAVQAEGIEVARYLNAVPPAQRIYDAHNPEFLLQRRASQTAPNLVGMLYSHIQWKRLERFERAIVRTSRLSMAVSQHDANQLEALAWPARPCVAVVPNGINISDFPFRQPEPSDSPSLLFIGTLAYRPNAQAQRWFGERVLPGVFASVPTARLFVVGAQPPEWLVKVGQHDQRIAVTGHVDDERVYLRRASALVLPLHVAAGSRLKALVAMASGVPIISTWIGMEGIEAEPGTHYIRADTESEWVAALSSLLQNVELRRRLAANGRALVEQSYDWQAIAPRLRSVYAALEA
jgi:glycosyltransferase involved in cell wall biosynthesis